LLVEGIRRTTEWLVWGERHGKPFTEIFRKHTLFEGFACVLRTEESPKALKVQVLQSMSILMLHMKLDASIDYLLSILNPCFEFPPDVEDDEMLPYFVTLLKSLSLRLNPGNMRHCLLDEGGGTALHGRLQLPVLNCALDLVAHADSMVQTAAQTVVLCVLRVDSAAPRAVAELAVAEKLVPKLSAIVESSQGSSEEERCRACQWMWGDAKTGAIAELNPARWSSARIPVETVASLKQHLARNQNRPVVLRYFPGARKDRLSNVADAIASLEKLLKPRISMENIMGFVEDLFDLSIPAVSDALRIHGFAEDGP